MINLLILTIGVYVVGNTGGYVVHWLLHQEWTGRAYRDHYNHHFVIYPTEDFLSEVYREPPLDADQAKYYLPVFALLCAPLLWWSWVYALVALVQMVTVLKVNAMIHDALHVIGHPLSRFGWYHELRNLHFEHHLDTSKNLGIFSFFADKLARTFYDARIP